MLVTHLRLLAAATVAMLTVLAAPAVDAQPGALFTPVDETPPSGPLDEITLRRRVVTIDLGQLDHAQAAVAAPPARPCTPAPCPCVPTRSGRRPPRARP